MTVAYLVNGPRDLFAGLHGCLTKLLSRDQDSQHQERKQPHHDTVTTATLTSGSCDGVVVKW